MRVAITLSVPSERKAEIEMRAKKAQKTVSAYVMQALDLVDGMISEDEILTLSKRAEKNYKQGKTKVLGSLSELMK